MKETTSYSVRIQSILSHTVEQLNRIDPAAYEYGKLINHTQTDHFFSLSGTDKKDISTRYFEFSVNLKRIMENTNRQMLQLTDIMLSADRACSESVIALCNRAFLPYLSFQENISQFLSHTEHLLLRADSVPLRELTLALRQLQFQARHACEELVKILLELDG